MARDPGGSEHTKYLSHNHADRLSTAMNNFHKALTRRWREVVTEAIVDGTHEFPRYIRRSVSPHSHQPLWNYWSNPGRAHIYGRHCAYVAWVESGQNGSLASVTCGGETGVGVDGVKMPDPSGGMVPVPQVIECGVGTILAQVEDWAWAERDHIFYKLPMFDQHNLGSIGAAHWDFLKVGDALALDSDTNMDGDFIFTPMGDREMAGMVESVSDRNAVGRDWWAGWTGLAASRAKSGFFASTVPTINNQSGTLGCLASLYNARACIIAMGRNNGLRWVEWATEKLGQREIVTTDLTDSWRSVRRIGLSLATIGSFPTPAAPVATPVGMVLLLSGFLAEDLLPTVDSERYAATIEEVVGALDDGVDTLNSDLDTYEGEYRSAVSELRSTISGIHSYNLELYDLTQNVPGGDQLDVGESNHGYSADIDNVMEIAQTCYDLSERYEAQLSRLVGASVADPHLADSDGRRTDADAQLLEVREMLEGFLRTTVGRYLIAGDQAKQAAEAYVEVDTSQQRKLERIVGDWEELDDVGRPDVGYDPDDWANETDRGGQDPGAGDGGSYVTESDDD